MNLSFTSIFESILFSSFMIFLLHVIIKFKENVFYANPRLILSCILFIILRCFLPYEFFFTVTLKSHSILPTVTNLLNYKTKIGMSLYQFLLYIWISIASIKFAILIIKQIKAEKTITSFPLSTYIPILKEVMTEKGIVRNIDLIEIPNLSTPALIGLRKTKIIVPQGISEKDLYYILLHEIEHYKQYDLYFVTALQLLCTVYWWNPIFYILRNTALNFIEFRIDNIISKTLDSNEKLNYLESILNIAKIRNSKTQNHVLGVGFYERQANITRRFSLVLEQKTKRGKALPIIFFITIFLSTFVIFEPYSIKDEYSKNTYSISQNSYFIENNSLFDLYINGEYYITVDRIDGFDNIKIKDTEK